MGTMLQANVTISEDMQIVSATDSCRALLGSCNIGSSFAQMIPESDRTSLLQLFRCVAWGVMEGQVVLPHVETFGVVQLRSVQSTLKYRARLMVCFPAIWQPNKSAVTLTFAPV